MRTLFQRKRKGFTLLELSIAIMMGISTGAMIITLFNQQLVFLKVYRTQNFLTEEAPIISMYVSRLVGKADRFRLHNTVAEALAGTNPRTDAASVVLLNFRQPDGTMRATILSFENRGGTGNALYYYVVPVNGVLGEPQWAVTRRPREIRFSMEQGVLRMGITGPNLEGITYSGSMQ